MSRAERYEELDRNGDQLGLIKAALDSAAIIINGKLFKPENPIPSEELADLLNASLNSPGNTARFEFDDGSFLEVSVVSRSGRRPGTVWIQTGMGSFGG